MRSKIFLMINLLILSVTLLTAQIDEADYGEPVSTLSESGFSIQEALIELEKSKKWETEAAEAEGLSLLKYEEFKLAYREEKKMASPIQLKQLDAERRRLKNILKNAKRAHDLSEKLVSVYTEMTEMTATKRLEAYIAQKQFEKENKTPYLVYKRKVERILLGLEFELPQRMIDADDESVRDGVARIKTGGTNFKKKLGEAEKREKELEKIRKKYKVKYQSPLPACDIESDRTDDFTGKREVKMKKSFLFAQTSDALKNYFKSNDYVSCHGSITKKEDEDDLLVLSFTIKSLSTDIQFGELPANSKLFIRLLDGTTVTLVNVLTDVGATNRIEGTTTYSGYYKLDDSQLDRLSKTEVDKIRVVWSTGYEDYEVYELDFFKNQIYCLED